MGILIAESLIECVADVIRINDRILLMKLVIGDGILAVVSAYAPQSGLSNQMKDQFYNELLHVCKKQNDDDLLVLGGDLNGHIGCKANGFEGIHGGHGFGERNLEGERILEFGEATEMLVANSFFRKRDSHLITYQSGSATTQVDYIMVKQRDLKLIKDVKVIPSEECVPQHKLLVCDLRIRASKSKPKSFTPKRRVWKLKDESCKEAFSSAVDAAIQEPAGKDTKPDVEELWSSLKDALLKACENVCGWSKKSPGRKETWWWNDSVNDAIKTKRLLWKKWKHGGSKQEYLVAKRNAKKEVYLARKHSEQQVFGDVSSSKDKRNLIFKMARRMKNESQDIIGEKCVRDDNGVPVFDDASKCAAWKSHYENLLNVEFPWDKEKLTASYPVAGPPIWITLEQVIESICKMKVGKAAGPTGVAAEMIQNAGEAGFKLIHQLINAIIKHEVIPKDWESSYIINCYKGKEDSMERGNYRGLKLLDQVLKVMERIVEKIIRESIEIDEMQFGFVAGKGTTDAIFILRQLQEKYLGKKRNLYIAFVDLEKAFDRVPREVIWWSMRKLGIGEWIVRVVQSMYANARSSVRVGDSYSEEFGVNVGVHQGSVLSPLLFLIVLEALSREFRTGCPWELLYADDLVIVAESLEELMEKLDKWKNGMEQKGLRVNMKKTKIMYSGPNLASLVDSGKWPCSVCRKGVGNNSILCVSCNMWVHKKCSGIKQKLKIDPTFKCGRCNGVARPIDGRMKEKVDFANSHLDVVQKFCYLGDTLGPEGGCKEATIARMRSGWKKFHELLPILTNRGISLEAKGWVFAAGVRSSMLYCSETWPLKKEDEDRIIRNDMCMVRWICGTRLSDRRPTKELLTKLGIPKCSDVIRQKRLRWYGHVQRMEDENWAKKCLDISVDGPASRGRPNKTWISVVNEDLKKKGLTKELCHNRVAWRKAIK